MTNVEYNKNAIEIITRIIRNNKNTLEELKLSTVNNKLQKKTISNLLDSISNLGPQFKTLSLKNIAMRDSLIIESLGKIFTNLQQVKSISIVEPRIGDQEELMEVVLE